MVRSLLMAALSITAGATASYAQFFVPQSMYGINTHVPSDAALAKQQAGHVAWARIDVNWNALEPAKGVFNWGPIDAVVSSANQRGIHLFATLAYTPGWANGGQAQSVPPTNPEDWKNFVRTVVTRYRQSIRHWGLWNEPNLSQFFSGSVNTYINVILIPGAEAIREADPGALRLAPEVSSNGSFLESVLTSARDHIDIVTVHKYDEQVSEIMRDFDGFLWPWENKTYREILEATGVFGVKPVWFTEVGWPTAQGTHVDTVTEQEQAALYVQLLDEVRLRPWITKIMFYELTDDPVSGVPKWGILNSNLTEKSAHTAFRDYVVAHPPSNTVTIGDLRRYQVGSFSPGSPYFSDRPYVITAMPAYLEGSTGVRTANDDGDETGAAWISFDVDADADVYVAYDRRATARPNWLGEYTEMSDVVAVSDVDQGYARLYRKRYRLGEIVLGANLAPAAAGALANYFVLVRPAGSGPPEPAASPLPADQATRIGLSAQLSWTPGQGATSHQVYFGDSDPPPWRASQSGTTLNPGSLSVAATYYWRIDEVNAHGTLVGKTWRFATISPDFDGDGDADMADYGHFQQCLTGPTVFVSDPACLDADLDQNSTVDQVDYAVFRACMSGANVLVAPDCAGQGNSP